MNIRGVEEKTNKKNSSQEYIQRYAKEFEVANKMKENVYFQRVEGRKI